MNTKFLACVFFAGMLVLSGCSDSHKSSYDYLSKARKFHKAGNDGAAVIELKNALQVDPKNIEARYLMALIDNERGDGQAAEIEIRKALELGLERRKASAVLSQALLLQRKYHKVLDDVKPSGNLQAQLAAAIYTARGDAYLGLGKRKEARASFEKAIAANPAYPDAYIGLARLAAYANDLAGALDEVNKALKKAPNSTLAWSIKGDLLRFKSGDKAAGKAYRKVLEIDKNNVIARLGLASIDMTSGKLADAKSEIDKAQHVAPDDLRVKYMRAVLEFRSGRYDKAHDQLQQIMKVSSDYMPGVLLMGVVGYELGMYEQAHKSLSVFTARFPANAYAAKFLAATDLKLNNPEGALKALEPVLRRNGKDPQVLALEGQSYLQKREYTKATQYFERAVKIEPKNAALRTGLGTIRMRAGDTGNAIRDFESAIELDPKHYKADALLLTAQLGKNQYDKALATARAWEKKQPDNPVTYNFEGVAYLGKKAVHQARKSFERALSVDPKYFPAAMNLAKLDLQDGDRRAAKKRFESILQKDKSNTQAMLALADLAASRNNSRERLNWLQRAVDAKPSDIVARRQLVDYYLNKDQKEKALNAARDALNANQGDARFLDLLGTVQLAAGDGGGALSTYSRLADNAPNSPEAQLRLGLAQMAQGKLKEARASFEKALKLKRDFLDAEEALIQLDLTDNNEGAALGVARRIQEQYSGSPVGYEREGDIFIKHNDYANAVKSYERALSKGAGSTGFIKLHHAMVKAGESQAAKKRLTSWLSDRPRDGVVLEYAAHYSMEQARNRDAIRFYQKLVKLQPKNARALNNLANLYQEEGDARSLKTAEQALKAAPENPGIQDTLGWILVQKGEDLSRAILLLRKAATGAPGLGVIHYHLAVGLAHDGKKAEAKKELNAAIKTNQEFPGLADAKVLLKQL